MIGNNEDVSIIGELAKPLFPIHILHRAGEDKWEITYSTSEEPIDVNYKSNLGIKYLAYLSKHCTSRTTAIRADELLEIVKKWEGKEIKKRADNPNKMPVQLDAADIKSAIHTSFVNRSKKLKIKYLDKYEIKHQEKLEELKLGNDYNTKKKHIPGEGFIEYFYYERSSNYFIEKVVDEDNEIFFPPD